jgi:hypothetical protein
MDGKMHRSSVRKREGLVLVDQQVKIGRGNENGSWADRITLFGQLKNSGEWWLSSRGSRVSWVGRRCWTMRSEYLKFGSFFYRQDFDTIRIFR